MNARSADAADSPACPFVAFDEDRRERAAEPDRRHRCYAESPPAARSTFHQQTYCLGADFADCPTFQEWARRRAVRDVQTAISEAEAADAGEGGRGEGRSRRPAASGRRTYDWAAPPPWMADRRPISDPDQLTAFDAFDAPSNAAPSSSPPASVPGGDPELAALLRRESPPRGAPEPEEGELPPFLARHPRPEPRRSGRPAVVRPLPARTISQAHPAGPPFRRASRPEPETPPWETPRHYEAYPAIRSRSGVPSAAIGIIIGAVALVFAAFVLIMLPGWLSGPSSSPSASPGASSSAGASGSFGFETVEPSLEPTLEPEPTTETYFVQPGDTMARIASRLGVTIEDLLAANPQITDPNVIKVGDPINVPPPATPEPLPGDSPTPGP
jgi:LysM repeat protein